MDGQGNLLLTDPNGYKVREERERIGGERERARHQSVCETNSKSKFKYLIRLFLREKV
jgi:hypothetical protein